MPCPLAGSANYSTPLAAWLEHFPPEQLYIIQASAACGDDGCCRRRAPPAWHGPAASRSAFNYILRQPSAFPPKQHVCVAPHVRPSRLQYEKLVAEQHEAAVLSGLRGFLGLAPPAPGGGGDSLQLTNHRKDKYEEVRGGEGWLFTFYFLLGQGKEGGNGGSWYGERLSAPRAAGSRPPSRLQGWRIQRWQYERLLELVRPDAQRVAELLQRHAPRGLGHADWLAEWEAAWRATLDTCDEAGECTIHPT